MSDPHHHGSHWPTTGGISSCAFSRSPSQEAKGNEEGKQQNKAGSHRPRGASATPAHRETPGRIPWVIPQTGVGMQSSPQLDLGRSDANARSCWTVANAKPQLRRGRGRQRVRHPEPKQTRCQLTACFTSSLVWAGQAGPCIGVWLEEERTKTKSNDATPESVTCQEIDVRSEYRQSSRCNR